MIKYGYFSGNKRLRLHAPTTIFTLAVHFINTENKEGDDSHDF